MRLGVAAGPFRSLAVARRDGAQQGPVLVGEGWTVVQAVQHCELVTQHDVLKALRASRAHSQARQRHEQPVQNATDRTPGCKRIMPGQRTRPNIGHPQAKDGAIAALQASRPGRRNSATDSELAQLRAENARLSATVIEQAVELAALRGKATWG